MVSLLRHWKGRLKSRLPESVRDRPSVGEEPIVSFNFCVRLP